MQKTTRHRRAPWACLLLVILSACVQAQPAPSLASDTALSHEGYFVLSWSSDAGATLQLQQASDTTFATPLTRTVPASGALTLTGLADGVYRFRVGTAGSWSETVSVTVEHHSLLRAAIFFLLGLALFLTLCTVILRGNAATGSGEERTP